MGTRALRSLQSVLLASLALALLVGPASADSDSEAASQSRRRETPRWELVLEQRLRYEALSDSYRPADADAGGVDLLPTRSRFRLAGRSLAGPLGFVFELQDARGFLDPEERFTTRTNVNELDVLQAHVRFELSIDDRLPLFLDVGRFTKDLGSRRLVARNQMRNTTNAFDGVSARLGGGGDRFRLQALFARPVEIRPEELDEWLDGGELWGVFFDAGAVGGTTAELYGFRREGGGNAGIYTLGGRWLRDAVPGRVGFVLEPVIQRGDAGGGLDQRSFFVHGEVEGAWPGRLAPRLSLQWDYASGDEDPNDDRVGTFDTLFGSRRFDFGPTGIHGAFARANLNTPGIRLFLALSPRIDLMTVHRFFWLAEARDEWAGTGLRDETGGSGTSLGSQFETRMRLRVLDGASIELGYAHFFKGSYPDLVPGSPRTPDSDYFYAAVDWTGSWSEI